MIDKAREELEKIEYKYRNYKNEFGRDLYIFENIAFNINSTQGEEKKFWDSVMDLHKKKIK